MISKKTIDEVRAVSEARAEEEQREENLHIYGKLIEQIAYLLSYIPREKRYWALHEALKKGQTYD